MISKQKKISLFQITPQKKKVFKKTIKKKKLSNA